MDKDDKQSIASDDERVPVMQGDHPRGLEEDNYGKLQGASLSAQQRKVQQVDMVKAHTAPMAPFPGQSNFAIVSKNTKSGQDFQRNMANSRNYGKVSILTQNNYPHEGMQVGEILIPREDKKSVGCCFRIFCPCYYLFCCCCCCETSFKVTRMRFQARFQKWINVKKQNFLNLAADDPVRGLLMLYAHQENAVNDLEQCRINPDFSSPFRNDLEYYIPQICCMYIEGGLEDRKDVTRLILNASKSDMFFSHRIWFFFQSLIFANDDEGKAKRQVAQQVVLQLKNICMENMQLLYLVNQLDILFCIVKFGMLKYYPHFKKHLEGKIQDPNEELQNASDPKEKFIAETKILIEKFATQRQEQVEALIKQYHEKQEKAVLDKFKEDANKESSTKKKKEQEQNQLAEVFDKANNQIESDMKATYEKQQVRNKRKTDTDIDKFEIVDISNPNMRQGFGQVPRVFKIEARDIILRNFLEQMEASQIQTEIMPYQQKTKDYVDAYLSTPRFIKALTDLSNDVLKYGTKEEKVKFVKTQLIEINKSLPAQVYIPFVNKSIRNYAVLNILAEEAKVFITKERAPLMLTFEMYRPTEVTIDENNELKDHQMQQEPSKSKKMKGFGNKKKNNQTNDNPYLLNFTDDSYMPLMQTFDGGRQARSVIKQHSNSFVDSVSSPNFAIAGRKNDNAKKQRKATFMDKFKGKNQSNQPKQNEKKFVSNTIRVIQSDGNEDNMIEQSMPIMQASYLAPSARSILLQPPQKHSEEQKIIQREISDHFDHRASNPVHVNNLHSLFGGVGGNNESKITGPSYIDLHMQSNLDNVASAGSSLKSDGIIQNDLPNKGGAATDKVQITLENEDDSGQIRQGKVILDTEKSHHVEEEKMTFSNNMFNLDKRLQSVEGLPLPSQQQKNAGRFNSFMDEDQNNQIPGIQPVNDSNKEPVIKINDRPTLQDMIDSNILKENPQQEAQETSKEIGNIGASQSMFISNDNSMDDLLNNSGSVARNINKRKASRAKSRDMQQISMSSLKQSQKKNGIFSETSKEQEDRIRKTSPYGELLTWKLFRVMVKSNDDIRQEQFANQLIRTFDQIFKQKKVNLWLKPYDIIATGQRCGLIEFATDSNNISGIKEKLGGKNAKLLDYFVTQFGAQKSKAHKTARQNFCQSLAAYSLLCYILQIKDRHNENIMLDIEGHLFHIDFGFLISNAPGKGVKFENAPFKLTAEFVEVLGGTRSAEFQEFRELMKRGFMALQENAEKIIIIIEMMFLGQNDLPCFKGGEKCIKELKDRFFPRGKMLSDSECQRFIDGLVEESYNNWRTNCYDNFQYRVQGIL